MKTEQDEIILVGKSFSPDIEKCEEDKVHIPKKVNQVVKIILLLLIFIFPNMKW